MGLNALYLKEKKWMAECKMEVLEWKANKNQDDDGRSLGTCCVAVFIIILIPVTAHWGLLNTNDQVDRTRSMRVKLDPCLKKTTYLILSACRAAGFVKNIPALNNNWLNSRILIAEAPKAACSLFKGIVHRTNENLSLFIITLMLEWFLWNKQGEKYQK